MALFITIGRINARSADPAMQFGVLGSTCDADRVEALREAGVDLVQMDVLWDQLEPVPGQLNRSYADELRSAFDTCKDADIEVVIGLGLQYAPEWVSLLTNGAYLDASGAAHPGHVPNIVFSRDVRQVFERHVANVFSLLPKADLHAVRIGTSETGELGYPGAHQSSIDSDTAFWAFDDAAQTGEGLPRGADRTPLPGWEPGDSTWRGQIVTAEQVTMWFSWYSDAVADAVGWQVDVLRNLGYAGTVHVPLAGRGVLPEDLRLAVNSRLDGTGDRDGSLSRGLYYPRQLMLLADRNGQEDMVADVTSLDDATAVEARSRQPATDSCAPGDHLLDLTAHPNVDQWSAARWTVANARKAGLDIIGENPGSPHLPDTGSDAKSDSLRDQMQHAPRYAVECGMSTFLWAFEDDLFGLAEYSRVMSSTR